MSAKETKEPVIVRLDQATLDDKGGEIVAHGWLNIDALQNLRVGDYQRYLIHLDVISTIATVFLIVCFILQTVKIRDRDKKPFFKPVERLATDGAH